MGILTMIFNRQILKYLGTDALSVYGMIINISTFVQCCAYSIFSTYYFQAMMKPSTAFVVSVSRGAVISGILIYLLPVIAGASGIWFAMPITELVVAVFMAVMMRCCQKQPIR